MVRTISPAADPEVWREDNSAPFWIPDDPRALSGLSFDDLVRTIDPRANPDVWRVGRAPRYAGWDDPERYAVPYDPRAAALGAFRIPGLPEDATGWDLRERLPAGVDEFSPVQLAQLGLLKALSKLGFSFKNRLLLREPPDGSIFRGEIGEIRTLRRDIIKRKNTCPVGTPCYRSQFHPTGWAGGLP